MSPTKPKCLGKKRSQTYSAALREVFRADFKTANQLIASGGTAPISQSEKNELLSLIEFQTGKHREARKTTKIRSFFVKRLRHSHPYLRMINGLISFANHLLSKVNLSDRLFDYLYENWFGDIIHHRYTDYISGLIKCNIMTAIASKTSRWIEKVYFTGLRGHFECLTGNFKSGLASLEYAYQELKRLNHSQNLTELTEPLIFHWLCEILVIQALHLSYAGHSEQTVLRYDELNNLLEQYDYFWIRVFALAMQMYHDLNCLDAENIEKRTIKLKSLLGEHFSNKFGLRTSAYSALVLSIQRDYLAAKEQLLSSESFYENTQSPVELGRYHFLRALTDLEFGNTQGAVQNSQRAISFMDPVPGSVAHSVNAKLLDIEVKLRTVLIQPDAKKQNFNIHWYLRALKKISREFTGAPILLAHIEVLKALCYYLKADYKTTSKLTINYKKDYGSLYPRLDYILSQFDPSMSGKKSFLTDAHHTAVRTDASLIDQIVKMLSSDDIEISSSNLLKSILSAKSCKIVENEIVTNNIKNRNFDISQVSSNRVEIELYLINRTVKYILENSLKNIEFDARLIKNLELTLSIVHSTFQQKSIEEAKRLAEIGKLAAQVSHDIKSPLAALDVVVSDLKQLPENKRIMIRSAVGRIKDIANNLLQLNRDSLREKVKNYSNSVAIIAPQLMTSIIEGIVSEKRVEIVNDENIEINYIFEPETYNSFANIQILEFERMLSNIINNAIESLNTRGKVDISVQQTSEHIAISVIDNGCGMTQDVLNKLGKRGNSFGKSNGNGLGLFHAKTTCHQWGGWLEVQSEIEVGTTVSIILPRAKTPSWFVPELDLPTSSIVYILDDDISVKAIWKQRLSEQELLTHDIECFYFSSTQELKENYDSLTNKDNILFLIDYEIIGDERNGLDLLEELGVGQKAILVSSRWNEKAVQERCINLGVRLIPKGLAGFVPINLEKALHHFDAVLLDNDDLVTKTWELHADANDCNIITFNNYKQFLKQLPTISRNAPVFIDSDLGNNLKGETFVEYVQELGFKEVYIASGYSKKRFSDIDHIRGVVGKEPPSFIFEKESAKSLKKQKRDNSNKKISNDNNDVINNLLHDLRSPIATIDLILGKDEQRIEDDEIELLKAVTAKLKNLTGKENFSVD